MKSNTVDQNRILRSAKALKAFFEQKLNTSLELLSQAPEPMGNGDVQFSLAMSQYGIWGVRAPQALASAEHVEIYETFHTILGAIGVMEARALELERLEANLDDAPANVIPLRRPSRLTSLSRDSQDDKRYILKLDCLIESKYVSEIHKMALELHTHSSRYAFLEYRDLNPVQRISVTDLIAMGPVSLFVPDIQMLTIAEQEVLRQLAETQTLSRPLLMVGTSVPFAELRSVTGIHLDFLSVLSRAYIKLTRPFSEYKDQGLIHYFLDSLSENPT